MLVNAFINKYNLHLYFIKFLHCFSFVINLNPMLDTLFIDFVTKE